MSEITANISSAEEKETTDLPLKRRYEYYQEVSGHTPEGKSKAVTFLSYYELYADDTRRQIEEYSFTKPFVSVMESPNYVRVHMDFGDPNDVDLMMAHQMLSRYLNPANSVSWTEEEEMRGTYFDQDGKERQIYYPIIELAVLPAGKEAQFQMIGLNPILFTLQPSMQNRQICELQFVFDTNYFQIITEAQEIDMDEMKKEAIAEREWEEKTGRF